MQKLKDLYFDQLRDLYDAEKRLVDALPQMADEATSKELKKAIESHLEETKGQVRRIEMIFNRHDMPVKRETCEAMKGLIEEGESELERWEDDADVKDAALIASAQRVEHYEIAGYGSARAYAENLGFDQDAQLLQETLEEEKAADARLSEIALGGVNDRARKETSSRTRPQI